MVLTFDQQLTLADAAVAARAARESVASFQRLLQKLRDADTKRAAEMRTAITEAILECDRVLEQLRSQGVIA
jgi:hypothetical protein